jgi:hypothetical protein
MNAAKANQELTRAAGAAAKATRASERKAAIFAEIR